MSDVDYEELFRSPLDEPDAGGGPGWAPLGAGLLVGVLVILLTAALLGGSEVATAPDTSATPSSEPPATVAPLVTPYPPGYQEYVPGLGLRAEEIVVGDDVVTVAFTTAVERDGDPLDQAWPIGGSWVLAGADGSATESRRVIMGRFSPGAFSVEFTAAAFADSPEFSEISLIERWDLPAIAGSSDLPFSGEPYALDEPLVVPVTSAVTLIVEEHELGRFLGKVGWRLQGESEPIGRVVVSAVLFDADGIRVGAYSSFPEIIEPAAAGAHEIFWSEPFPTSQDGAVTVEIEYEVGLVAPSSADLAIDLTDVPVGR